MSFHKNCTDTWIAAFYKIYLLLIELINIKKVNGNIKNKSQLKFCLLFIVTYEEQSDNVRPGGTTIADIAFATYYSGKITNFLQLILSTICKL